MRTCPVTAPFDGVVLARNIAAGDAADSNTLVELADLSNIWVELHAIGKNASRIAAGQPVVVRAATGGEDPKGRHRGTFTARHAWPKGRGARESSQSGWPLATWDGGDRGSHAR